jgi:hypothetical protein
MKDEEECIPFKQLILKLSSSYVGISSPDPNPRECKMDFIFRIRFRDFELSLNIVGVATVIVLQVLMQKI